MESERLGFDQVWIPDHLVDIKPFLAIFDSWTALGFLGAKTSSIRIGSGVTDIQRIHPAKIANIIATLDNLTKGRAVLGIGSGEIMNTQPFGIPWEDKKTRLKRLKESIEVIKLLWSSSYDHPVKYSGEFFHLDNARLSLSPVQKPRPPIYIGSFASAGTLRIVGEVADGWYPGSQHIPDAYAAKVQIIRDAAMKAGRSADSIDIMVSVPTLICDDEQLADLKRKIKLGLKKKIILNQHLLKTYGIEDAIPSSNLPKELDYQFATPGPEYDMKLSRAVEELAIPDEVLEKLMNQVVAVGAPDDCVTVIEKFIKAGATHVFFSNMLGTRENYRLISEKIIPALSQN